MPYANQEEQEQLAAAIADRLKQLEGGDEEADFWETAAHWDGEAICVRYKKGDGFWALSPSQAVPYLKQLESGRQTRHIEHDEKVVELSEIAAQLECVLQSFEHNPSSDHFLLEPRVFAGGGLVNIRYVSGETWWTLTPEEAKDYLKTLGIGTMVRHHKTLNEEAG